MRAAPRPQMARGPQADAWAPTWEKKGPGSWGAVQQVPGPRRTYLTSSHRLFISPIRRWFSCSNCGANTHAETASHGPGPGLTAAVWVGTAPPPATLARRQRRGQLLPRPSPPTDAGQTEGRGVERGRVMAGRHGRTDDCPRVPAQRPDCAERGRPPLLPRSHRRSPKATSSTTPSRAPTLEVISHCPEPGLAPPNAS